MCKIESCSEKDSGDNSDNKKKTFTEKVSERLKDIMGEKGIDITRLSEAIGVSKSTISRYLKGMRVPKIEILVKIADCFQCPLDYFATSENYEEGKKFSPCPPFPERFRFLFEHFHKSRYALCHGELHISESVLYNWQNGKCMPTAENVYKWRNFSIVPWISSWAEATELFEGYIEPCAPAHGVFGILFFETLTFW